MELLTNRTPGKQKVARTGAALLLASSVGASCGKPAPLCHTPREVSGIYQPDTHATADRSTWTDGVAIHTTPPEGARSIIVGFRAPGGEWTHDSQPIAPKYAESIVVRLGNGPVQFSVYAEGREGDAACTATTGALFSEPQPVEPVVAQGATQPTWR